eukprot:g35875.t1
MLHEAVNNLIASGDFLSTASNLIDTQPRTTRYVEQPLFCSYTSTIPPLLLRYFDDCTDAVSGSHEDLKQFIHFTNTFQPDLKFTWTISNTSLPFQDTSISGNRLSADIYFKLIDSHNYLDYTSSHPPCFKNVIPYSPIPAPPPHLLPGCSVHSRTSQMFSIFKDCNFPSPMIHNALYCISHTYALKAPHPSNNKDRVPLVLTYHPTNLLIQRIILRHFRHLQSTPAPK